MRKPQIQTAIVVAGVLVCTALAFGEEPPVSIPAGRVEQPVLKAVVKIRSSPKPGETSLGTGFLASREISGPSGIVQTSYLITNKHIISDWDLADGSITNYSKTLEVFFYRTADPAGLSYRPLIVTIADDSGNLLSGKVVLHSDPSVDIAVVRLDKELLPANNIDLVSFDRSYFIPFSNVINRAGIGDLVFALGYPQGITSLINSYPIAKAGYIASMPSQEFKIDFPVKNRNGQLVVAKLQGKIIIVDGVLVPGNSGGPVVVPAETKVRVNPKTKQFEYSLPPAENFVVGIVSSIFDNAGLAIVFSSDYILEMLDKMP